MHPTIVQAQKEIVTSRADGKSTIEIGPSPTSKQHLLLELWQYNSFNPPSHAAISLDLATLDALIAALQAARASLATTTATAKKKH